MSRSKGTGSIVRLEDKPKGRCRRWRLRVVMDGKRREKRFVGTYAQAEKALQEFAAELESPQTVVTFSEYAKLWERRRERSGEYALQTLEKEKTGIRRLAEAFGDIRLSDIDRQLVVDGMLAIKESREPPLSGTTMNKSFALMKQIMESARLDGLLRTNPLDTIKAPKIDTREKQAVSLEQVLHMLRTLETWPLDSHTVAVRLAVLGGFRRSEIVGLEWRDLSNGMILTRRSVAERDGSVKAPKSSAGVRRVPVMPMLAKSLEAWRIVQAEQLEAIGLSQTPETPLVTSSTGTRMRAQNLYRWWSNHRAELGVDCTLHELRHTFLTMLAASGASELALTSIAGWSDIGMARTYCHTSDAANVAAVEGLQQALGDGTF